MSICGLALAICGLALALASRGCVQGVAQRSACCGTRGLTEWPTKHGMAVVATQFHEQGSARVTCQYLDQSVHEHLTEAHADPCMPCHAARSGKPWAHRFRKQHI
eukprot:14312244-Alexandrium_andersonii.AAC.1